MVVRPQTIDSIYDVRTRQKNDREWLSKISTLFKRFKPVSDQYRSYWILNLYTPRQHTTYRKMNKEIKSTQSIKRILDSMMRIPSFNLRFESAQDYVEYAFKRDLEMMKRNPTRKIWWSERPSNSHRSNKNKNIWSAAAVEWRPSIKTDQTSYE